MDVCQLRRKTDAVDSPQAPSSNPKIRCILVDQYSLSPLKENKISTDWYTVFMNVQEIPALGKKNQSK